MSAAVRAFAEQRVLVCLLGAVVWAAPRALWPGEGQLPVGGPEYLALVGCGLLSLLLIAVSFGPRALPEPDAEWRAVLTLGLSLALVPWSVLGYSILVLTHHRPLGAVAFAVGAAVTGWVCVGVARWAFAVCQASPRWGKALIRAGWTLAFLAAGAALLVAARAALQQVEYRAAVPDVALGLVLAVAVARLPTAGRAGRVTRFSLPICIGVWVLTLWLMNTDADVRATVKSAPVIAGMLGLMLG